MNFGKCWWKNCIWEKPMAPMILLVKSFFEKQFPKLLKEEGSHISHLKLKIGQN